MCHLAQQGTDPAPTGCVKFRPTQPGLDAEEEHKARYSGKTLLSVNADGVISHWIAMNGKLQHTMQQEANSLFCGDFASDGLKFTCAGKDMAIYLYDEETKQLVSRMTSNGYKLLGHQNRVFCNKFLPDDPNVLITGSWDRIMKIYDTRVGHPVGQILGP